MRKQMRTIMIGMLAIGVGVAGVLSSPVSETAQVEAAGYSYSADQLQALATLNEYRKEAGMNPVTLDPFLTKAASNHYAYLNTNGHAYGHSEVKGHKGFTGVKSKDRVKAVGGSLGQLVGENIVFGARNSPNSIYDLVHNAPLHRESLLNPDIQSVGFAVEKGNQKGMHVIVVRVDSYEQRDSDHVYPVPNMKNVNPLFAGNEIPDPLKDYGIDQSGHILTYWYPSEAFIYDESDFSFVLKDSKGNVVPAFVDFKRNQASRLIPKKRLNYNETYTATVKWYSPDNNQRGGRTWSFTTMANTTTPVKPTTPPVTSVKESKDYTVIKGQPLYASNSTKSKQLVQIPTNGKVRSIEKRSSWMKVTYKGKTGWVAVKNLKAYVAPKTESKYANKNMKAYTTRSTKGKVAFTVPKGKKVTRIAVNGSWSQVKYGSKTGWVASRDLSSSAPK
ncbi:MULTISPECIES: SH3 domain-containing protein [Exiguobacterium]|uniref:SH3 domain-containing protein n=1 Tax=Exiguobacterium TaxID=33986 RepID=UPI0025BA201B|nr:MULTISPECIES: SH3 domain-containing protein [Exiguobacterium]